MSTFQLIKSASSPVLDAVENLADHGPNRVDHLMGFAYTIIGSLSEMCRPQEKFGITRFSKTDFILSVCGFTRGQRDHHVAER